MQTDKILLVGNPNVGKTSVFNRITRSNEHVGNWHGVTVEEKSKIITYKDKTLKIVDLPGLYSLTVYSPEEAVSRDAVISGKGAPVLDVCDANNLPRNLFLTLQLLEAGANVVVAANMTDELNVRGLRLDEKLLSERLGVPVVSISAKKGKSAFFVLDACVDRIKKKSRATLPYLKTLPTEKLCGIIEKNANEVRLNVVFAAVKLMEHDDFVAEKLNLSEKQLAEIAALGDLHAALVSARYGYIEEILDGAVLPLDKAPKTKKYKLVEKVKRTADRLALSKYFALPTFLLVILCVFFITFGTVGPFFSGLIGDFFVNCVKVPLFDLLTRLKAPDWTVGLICDGIVGGVCGILVFLPQILLLFFFLAVMEDSGYVSRVAFMTDGLFEKIGLSGKSVFTLLMGFGCCATAVLTTRGLEDEKMRKKTALITSFMSCSARLPVYSTIAFAYFTEFNYLIIFGLYALGTLVAVAVAAVMENCTKKLKSGKPSFIMEMPPYRFPTFERIIQILWVNVKNFLLKVGTTVFALGVIMWVLSNFSLTEGYGGESDSIMMTLGKILAHLFAPLGFGSWKAVTALIGGVVAKEAVVSTIQSLGGVETLFVGEYAGIDALSFMVYTLLYVPCLATVSALIKETGAKWALFAVTLQLCVAYAVTFIVRVVALTFVNSPGLAVSVCLMLVAALISLFLAFAGKNVRDNCEGCVGNCAKCK